LPADAAPTHTTTLAVGQRLDRYELLRPIAEGGMASVWAARQHGKHKFEKLVAVKTILPELARQSHFRSMLLDEARIASRVDHPNVVRILDLGDEKDLLYLVMEWVDGDSLWSLRQRLKEEGRTMPAGIALRVLADLCGGLHAVHELRDESGAKLSVVHRDVSPENILIDLHGNAKLIDFGVAKARNRLAEETVTGVLKGKLHYMSPEQAMFRPVDRRADIWAVGAILYRLFAGVPPFRGETREETLRRLRSGQKPPPLPPTVPHVVAAVAERALMHDPAERFATAAELKAALEAALVAIHARTTVDDVADFVAKNMSDVIEARRLAMSLALRSSSGRSRIRTEEPASIPDRQAETIPDIEQEEDEDDDDDNVPTPVLDWPVLPLKADNPLFPVMSAAGAPELTFETPSVRRSSHRSWRAFLVVGIVASGVLAALLGRRTQPVSNWTPLVGRPLVQEHPLPKPATAAPGEANAPPVSTPPPSVAPLRLVIGSPASSVEPKRAAAATSANPAPPRARPPAPRPRRIVKASPPPSVATTSAQAVTSQPSPTAAEPARPAIKPPASASPTAVDDGF
jgi:serine/threonine-protein kinase